MARKTNKTAHVLNLLSGSNSQKNPTTESLSEEKRNSKSTPAVSSIRMDTTDKDDVISDIIHQQLMSSFIDEQAVKKEDTEEAILTLIEEELTASIKEVPTPEPEIIAESSMAESISKVEDVSLQMENTSSQEQVIPEQYSAPEETSDSEKEPEFVVLNVIERIVSDKIIYFMRQFDVCTCDRCIADTIALTLNGLKPKYLVTPPAAVSPLISFYTSKYISDITVEATKACMTIKEKPRHKNTDETL